MPLSDFLGVTPGLTSSAQYDDYARLLTGRPEPQDAGRVVSPAVSASVAFGRYGSFPAESAGLTTPIGLPLYRPGRTFNNATPGAAAATREERVPFDFAGYPEFAADPLRLSGFGRRPDLMSRYAVGLSPTGAPVDEATFDGWLHVRSATIPDRALLDDSPYELDLSPDARRRSAEDLSAILASYGSNSPLNDDATFSPAELERLLRAFDADADRLPDRLWNLVDAFDPDKLAVQEAITGGAITPDSFAGFRPSSLEAVRAQTQAAINRRQVTTESFDPPVPNENWTARLILGADGLPGVPFVANDGISRRTPNAGRRRRRRLSTRATKQWHRAITPSTNPTAFDPSAHVYATDPFPTPNLWRYGCDDYPIVMLSDPPPSARITDFFRYRITLQLARDGIITLYPHRESHQRDGDRSVGQSDPVRRRRPLDRRGAG